MTEPWRLTLLGDLRAECGDQVITRFSSQKAASLLAYLAYHGGHAHTRDILVEKFWPDVEPESGRNNLSTALWSLRKLLEPKSIEAPGLFVADRFTISVNRDAITTDVAEFERHIHAADIEAVDSQKISHYKKALDLYRQPLLTGLYDDWIEAERSRLDIRFAHAARTLIKLHSERGSLTDALGIADHLVTVAPLNEEAHLALMKLLVASGRPADALRRFSNLERTLQDELQTAPSEEIERFAASLRRQATPTQANQKTGPVREDDLDTRSGLAGPAAEEPALRTMDRPRSHRRLVLACSGALALFCVVQFAPAVNTGTKISRASSLPPGAGEPVTSAPGGPVELRPGGSKIGPTLSATTPRLSVPPISAPQGPQRPKVEGKELWVRTYENRADEFDTEATGMISDSQGSVYVCGFVQTKTNDTDFLTFKFSADGKLRWTKRYNGPANDCDRARSIAVCPNGGVVVTGDSYGGNREDGKTQWDFATVKYDADGHEEWVQRFNGPPHNDDFPLGVGTDSAGNAYVGGTSQLPDKSTTFVTVKYDLNGQQLWAQPESANASGAGPTVGLLRAFYVGPRGDTYRTCEAEITDGFGKRDLDFVTSRHDRNGNLLWQRRYSGDANGPDKAYRIAVDPEGSVYVAGVSFLGADSGGRTGEHILVVKYDRNGTELWTTPYRDRSSPGVPDGLAISEDGGVFVSAHVGDPDRTSVLVKLRADGAIEWAKRFTEWKHPAERMQGVAAGSGGVYTVCRTFDKHVESAITGGEYITARIEANGRRTWTRGIKRVLKTNANCSSVHIDSAGNVFTFGQVYGTHPQVIVAKYSP